MSDVPRAPASPLLRIARGPHDLPSYQARAGRGAPGGASPAPGRASAGRRSDETERCEFCATAIPGEHGHVMHLGRRALLCVCRACYLLFTQHGAARGLFLSVPERYRALEPRQEDAGWWLGLQAPVGLAFFVRGTPGVRGFYPSPANAIASDVPEQAWHEAVQCHPEIGTMMPEVEALLVRAQASPLRAYLVPIDVCYELVGRLRLSWQGFSGGDEVRAAVDGMFRRIDARCRAEAAS